MAVATHHPVSDSAAAEPQPRLFTIDELEAMVRLGIIGSDEHVELIEGQIVRMNPQGTGHIWAVSELIRVFARADGVVVTAQSTLQIADRSGPEPDLVVLRKSASRRSRPNSNDALLVVEVADTSLRYDRQVKAEIYARAGIPEYWIVDLNGERVEAHTEPSPEEYRAVHIFVRGDRLSPAFSSDIVVAIDEVLGPSASEDEANPSAEERSADGS